MVVGNVFSVALGFAFGIAAGMAVGDTVGTTVGMALGDTKPPQKYHKFDFTWSKIM
jgi:hypothetical protein